MLETIYEFATGDEPVVERLVDDGHAHINHVVLAGRASLPAHVVNSNVHLILVRGAIELSLEGGAWTRYASGRIVGVPFDTAMEIRNPEAVPLEFFIVKAPHPSAMPPVKVLKPA